MTIGYSVSSISSENWLLIKSISVVVAFVITNVMLSSNYYRFSNKFPILRNNLSMIPIALLLDITSSDIVSTVFIFEVFFKT